MDRAGLAGADGPTHHGAFDIAYMLLVPGMTVTAPKDGAELVALLRAGLEHDDGPYSIRYPRDTVPYEVPPATEIPPVAYGSWEILRVGLRARDSRGWYDGSAGALGSRPAERHRDRRPRS